MNSRGEAWVRLSGLTIIALLAAALGGPRPAAAQLTAADSAAVLVATAADFEERGELEVARALYEEVVRRYPGTPGAALARARLEGLGAPEGPTPAGPAPGGAPQDRRGDTEFRVWSTMYGLWLGVAVPMLAEAQGSEPYGAGLLLGGPTGYLVGRMFSRSLSVGRSRTISWAGTWGTWQGAGWAHALNLGAESGCEYCEPGEKETVTAALAGGLAGIVTASLLARETTEGTAAATYLGSLWGTWFGLGGATALDLDDEAMWASTLLVGNAGLIAGTLAGSRFDLSSRRAHMISLGGLIGGFGGIGIVLITKPGSTSSEFAIPLPTSLAGLGFGALLTGESEDAPAGESNAARAASGSSSPALLNWSEGEPLAVGLPLPFPTTVFDPGRSGRRHTAWSVPLLRLRF
ncbi:tetratricopeptide repeat protein [Candidatus Palauibacter sp.]|uniref:tetratricopeptide repeat protein n=1 Tax=Candidatus Palauibacter sp. TaxID=3101350 RepID=UPI003B5B8C2D